MEQDQTQSEQVQSPDPQIPVMQMIGYFEPGVGLSIGIVPRGHDHNQVIAKVTYRNMSFVTRDLQPIIQLANECTARIALESGYKRGYEQAMRDVAAQAAANDATLKIVAPEGQVREAVIDIGAAVAEAQAARAARGNEPPEGRTDVEAVVDVKNVPDLNLQVPEEQVGAHGIPINDVLIQVRDNVIHDLKSEAEPAGGWMTTGQRSEPVSDREWSAQDPSQREAQP